MNRVDIAVVGAQNDAGVGPNGMCLTRFVQGALRLYDGGVVANLGGYGSPSALTNNFGRL